MKPTAPFRCNFSEVFAVPCGGLSFSRQTYAAQPNEKAFFFRIQLLVDDRIVT